MVQNIVLTKIVSKIVENIVGATIDKFFIAKYMLRVNENNVM